MTTESGDGKLGQFPFGNTALRAYGLKPFIPQVSGGPAVSGIPGHKFFTAMSDDPGRFS